MRLALAVLLLAAPPALAQAWQPLRESAAASGFNGPVSTVERAEDGSLWVAGWFTEAPGGVRAHRVARWDGARWSGPTDGPDGVVTALLLEPDGSVVVGGVFSRAGGVAARNVARWRGGRWEAMGEGLGPTVRDLARGPDGSIVAGGVLRGGGVHDLARWDGTRWGPLGDGVRWRRANAARPMNPDPVVIALGNGGDGALYVAGLFQYAGVWDWDYRTDDTEAIGAARWDGQTWAGLPRDSTSEYPQYPRFIGLDVAALPGGRVLVAGNGYTESERFGFVEWTGTAFVPLDTAGVEETTEIAVGGGGEVVFAGTWDGGKGIGRLRDGAVELLGELRYGVGDLLVEPDGGVVAVGHSGRIGGVLAPFFARYDGAGWSGVGLSTNGAVEDLFVAVDGDLWASGSFSVAGQTPADGFARWDGARWHAEEPPPVQITYQGTVVEDDQGRQAAVGSVAVSDALNTAAVAVRERGGPWTLLDPFPVGSWSGRVLLEDGLPVAVGTLCEADFERPCHAVAQWNGERWVYALEGWSGRAVAAFDGRPVVSISRNVGTDYMQTVDDLVIQSVGGGSFVSLDPPRPVYHLATGPDGTLVAAGDSAVVYAYDGAGWTEAGRVPGARPSALAVAPDGAVWLAVADRAGGNGERGTPGELWTLRDGGAERVAVLDGPVRTLAFGRGGAVYAGGAFFEVDGEPIAYVAAFAGGGTAAAPASEPGPPVTLGPNPARGEAWLSLTAEHAAPLRVEVLDALGRRVSVAFDGAVGAGPVRVPLGVGGVAPGVYLVRVVLGGVPVTRTLSVVR